MSAWSAAGDFDPDRCGIMQAADDLLGQVRDAMHGRMSGPDRGSRDQGAPDRSRGQGEGGRQDRRGGRGGPWARRGGPWERGFGFAGRADGRAAPPVPRAIRVVARAAGGPGRPARPRGPKAGRGDVRAAILALLREGPRNGYQIMSEIEERSGGAWRPSPGAVYPALHCWPTRG